MRNLLLLSNSTNAGEPFLGWPETYLKEILGTTHRNVLFVPFAAVRLSFDDYTTLVRDRLALLGHSVKSLHEVKDVDQAIRFADAIVIGGGNTFHLLHKLYECDALEAIRERVEGGIPYIGWSAGSNVACPTIRTTNDMPIIEPPSLKALNLVPFQLNPHYTNAMPPGLRAETRDDRLLEFIEVNRKVFVLGLPERTLIRLHGDKISLIGAEHSSETRATLFHYGNPIRELHSQDDLSFLLDA